MKTILSLFDYSGIWSDPYKDAGYRVIKVDIKSGIDILEWDYKAIDNVHGILAAPPCTCFSSSGARWWPDMDSSGRTADMVKLVHKTLEIVEYFQPEFYAIENPVGRVRKLVPEIGEPWYFQPCDYGDPYTKKTGIYGKFTKPLPELIGGDWSVEPTLGSKMHMMPDSKGRAERRSQTPPGFARAFFICNQ